MTYFTTPVVFKFDVVGREEEIFLAFEVLYTRFYPTLLKKFPKSERFYRKEVVETCTVYFSPVLMIRLECNGKKFGIPIEKLRLKKKENLVSVSIKSILFLYQVVNIRSHC